MAVTKIKPIRGTVNKALAYILDPKKTDDQLYVSSFGCAASEQRPKNLSGREISRHSKECRCRRSLPDT
jgi:hypothetical protein